MEAVGVGEGIAVGMLKEWVREAILEGEIPNEHDPAFAYVMDNREEALRRARLFTSFTRSLEGPERAATGAVKEAIFWDRVPADPQEAESFLNRVKKDALASRHA